MAWEQPLHSEPQANAQASVEALRGGGKEVLPLCSPAPCSRVTSCVPLTCDFSRYPLNGEFIITYRLEML